MAEHCADDIDRGPPHFGSRVVASAQHTRHIWHLDPEATAALVPLGSPFADPRFLYALERFEGRYETEVVGARAEDGTRATLAVAVVGSEASSIPFGYGGIVADRSLEQEETASLHRLVGRQLAARGHVVRRVRSRYVPLPVRGRPTHTGGRVLASTAVVMLAGGGDGIAKKARQSIRRADRAGVVVRSNSDPARFLSIYESASRRFQTVYPPVLIGLAASAGLGRSYEAAIGEEVVAAAFVLTGKTEWMYWLAAETDRGRAVEAGYPIVAKLLADARDDAIGFVNLGASTGLPGVAKFKRRFGSVDLPVIEQSAALSPLGLIPDVPLSRSSIRAVLRRVRTTGQGMSGRTG